MQAKESHHRFSFFGHPTQYYAQSEAERAHLGRPRRLHSLSAGARIIRGMSEPPRTRGSFAGRSGQSSLAPLAINRWKFSLWMASAGQAGRGDLCRFGR
jgi:hypothetical protein